jgi:predicted phage-related endonuclease
MFHGIGSAAGQPAGGRRYGLNSIATGPYRVILADSEAVPREEWLRARKPAICSSDYPQIVGLSSFGTAIDIFEDKIEPEQVSGAISLEQKFRFDIGHALEPVILTTIAANIHARPIRDKRLVESTLYPYMRNDVDGLFEMLEDRVIQGVPFSKGDVIMFEGKTTNYISFMEWRESPSPAHVAQSKHGMLVRGLRWAIIGYWKGNNLQTDLVYHLVPLTEVDIATIPLVCREFFEHSVNPKIPPNAALGPYAAEFKKALLRHYSGVGPRKNAELKLPYHTQPLFEQALSIRAKHSALNEQMKELEIERDKIDAQFISMLGAGYKTGVLDSIYRTFTASISSSTSPVVSSENLERLRQEDPKVYDDLVKQGFITQRKRESFTVRCIQKSATTTKTRGRTEK